MAIGMAIARLNSCFVLFNQNVFFERVQFSESVKLYPWSNLRVEGESTSTTSRGFV